MTRLRLFLAFAGSFVGGAVLGCCVSQYFVLVCDFPRAMALRTVLPEVTAAVPPSSALRLLDLYEIEVNRQKAWFGFTKFDWDQELINIELRRYLLYARADQPELAEKSLVRAATRRSHRPPTNSEIEFERQLALRAFFGQKRDSSQSN